MIKLNKRTVLTNEQKQAIVARYRDQLERMEDLAAEYNVTRQCIWKVLQHEGINTTKANRVCRVCYACGKVLKIRRARARKNDKSFCDQDCYSTYLHTIGEDYNPSTYYCRVSREIVAKAWPDYHPGLGYVVHHVNGDDTDTRLHNLEVYASQSDHLRKHRGQDIKPIWKGLLVP